MRHRHPQPASAVRPRRPTPDTPAQAARRDALWVRFEARLDELADYFVAEGYTREPEPDEPAP